MDAGGGTVDVSTYQRVNSHEGKRMFEEIAVPQCKRSIISFTFVDSLSIAGYFHGSVFVTFQAKDFLKGVCS